MIFILCELSRQLKSQTNYSKCPPFAFTHFYSGIEPAYFFTKSVFNDSLHRGGVEQAFSSKILHNRQSKILRSGLLDGQSWEVINSCKLTSNNSNHRFVVFAVSALNLSGISSAFQLTRQVSFKGLTTFSKMSALVISCICFGFLSANKGTTSGRGDKKRRDLFFFLLIQKKVQSDAQIKHTAP